MKIKVWEVRTEIETQLGERIFSSEFYTEIAAKKFYNALEEEAKYWSFVAVTEREVLDHEVVLDSLSDLIDKELASCL